MITPLRALVRKDIQLFLTDRRALMMSVIAPIAIASFFGYALGGAGSQSEPSRISVLVADQDDDTISHGILQRLSSEKALAVKPAGTDDARAAVRKGTVSVAIIIPPHFGQDAVRAFFSASQKPQIAVLYDPSHAAERAMVQGMLTGDVMQVVSQEMFGGATGRATLKEALDRAETGQDLPAPDRKSLINLLQSVQRWNDTPSVANYGLSRGLTMPYTTHEEAVTSRQGIRYNGYAHAFAGMAVQFVLFLGIDVGIGLLLQRQRGLWKRFRAAPLSRVTLLGSRIISAAILAFVIVLANFLFARLVFGVRVEGSMAGFLGVSAAFALMTAAFGLLIAALGKTPDATRGLAILATLFMVMLGGAWVPMFLFPQWLQQVTVVMPTRWAIDGFEAMTWRGLGFSAALVPMALQLLFALLFGLLAVARFRWEAEG
ncbi:MAG TPA: ABC transporter permease [Bryobacteraceae bacterium]|nr:ABC transporter permease [Bryobacteraceae bacterium]